MSEAKCPRCHGTAELPTHEPCPRCEGFGWIDICEVERLGVSEEHDRQQCSHYYHAPTDVELGLITAEQQRLSSDQGLDYEAPS